LTTHPEVKMNQQTQPRCKSQKFTVRNFTFRNHI